MVWFMINSSFSSAFFQNLLLTSFPFVNVGPTLRNYYCNRIESSLTLSSSGQREREYNLQYSIVVMTEEGRLSRLSSMT